MELRKSSILMGAVAAAMLVGMGSARATTYDLLSATTTLDNLLIAGNSATVGSLSFVFVPGSFVSTQTGGTPGVDGHAPTAAQITVSALTTVPGEPGIVFSDNWFANAGVTVDTKFQFTVSSSAGWINDDYLATDGVATPNSSWTVNESVQAPPGPAGATLANFGNSSGNIVNYATATFAAQPSLFITKDIGLVATTGHTAITDVAQGFSTVPLPDAAWMGSATMLGMAAIAGLRKRMRLA